jgi:hypothetical protein
MDSQDLDTAFTVDRHFADQGFKTGDGGTVPGGEEPSDPSSRSFPG